MKPGPDDKLLSEAIKAGNAMRWNPAPSQVASAEVDHSFDPSSFSIGSSGAKGKWVK
ncbi:unnamed protein product [Arabis nemorensis]|uniref:Uncharacterized protein n=1 Tax=Arabis nemorensis TaxID=586526 RepID=A0A565CKY4_9BRAS|nr:unnamed protein product [Arabis nemorensis]